MWPSPASLCHLPLAWMSIFACDCAAMPPECLSQALNFGSQCSLNQVMVSAQPSFVGNDRLEAQIALGVDDVEPPVHRQYSNVERVQLDGCT